MKTKQERQQADWNAPKCKVCGGVLGLQSQKEGLDTHLNCTPKENEYFDEYSKYHSYNICEYEREIKSLKEDYSRTIAERDRAYFEIEALRTKIAILQGGYLAPR